MLVEMQAPHNVLCAPPEVLPKDERICQGLNERIDSLLISPKKQGRVVKRKKKRRGVRFASIESVVVGTLPMREELSTDEVSGTWWSESEYQGFRLGAKFLTKDVRSREKDLIVGIEEAYARALHFACTLSDDDYDELMADCSGQVLCLQPWCARKISARGLERYTSRKHRFERTEFAEETRAAVLRLSQNQGISDEQLSVFYREYARSAAIYARFCGEADYAVTKALAAESKAKNKDTASTKVTATGNRPTLSRQPSCDRRDMLRRSKEPSRGRLLVRELSQRRIETAV